MLDKMVEDQIQLYLKYSSIKNISIDEYIRIRKQAAEELSSGICNINNIFYETTKITHAADTIDASDASDTSSAMGVMNKSCENTKTSSVINKKPSINQDKVISITEGESRKNENKKDDEYLLQLLKSVKE